MRRAYYAGRSGNWGKLQEKYQKDGRFSAWANIEVKELYEKVVCEDVGFLSIVQGILLKSTGVLQRIIAPIGGVGGVALSYVCPHCHCFPLEGLHLLGLLQGLLRNSAICGVRRVAASTIRELRTGSYSYMTLWILERQKYFERTLRQKEMCDKLINR